MDIVYDSRNISSQIMALTEQIKLFSVNVLGRPCRILGMIREEDHWEITCEIDVDSEYTTRKGLGDIVEVYEICADPSMCITGFKLKQTRRKAALDE